MKFKVGDMVKFKKNIYCPNKKYFKNGYENLKILSVDDIYMYIKEKNSSMTWCVLNWEIEHMAHSWKDRFDKHGD
jgi:hypothetical protein